MKGFQDVSKASHCAACPLWTIPELFYFPNIHRVTPLLWSLGNILLCVLLLSSACTISCSRWSPLPSWLLAGSTMPVLAALRDKKNRWHLERSVATFGSTAARTVLNKPTCYQQQDDLNHANLSHHSNSRQVMQMMHWSVISSPGVKQEKHQSHYVWALDYLEVVGLKSFFTDYVSISGRNCPTLFHPHHLTVNMMIITHSVAFIFIPFK